MNCEKYRDVGITRFKSFDINKLFKNCMIYCDLYIRHDNNTLTVEIRALSSMTYKLYCAEMRKVYLVNRR
jgi:hypothetical protein